MPEEIEKIDLFGKVKSMKDLCDIIQGVVDRTEIAWLEVDNGVLQYQPVSDVPPSGNGPIKNLIKHLMWLERWMKEANRYLVGMRVEPFQAELILRIDLGPPNPAG